MEVKAWTDFIINNSFDVRWSDISPDRLMFIGLDLLSLFTSRIVIHMTSIYNADLQAKLNVSQ